VSLTDAFDPFARDRMARQIVQRSGCYSPVLCGVFKALEHHGEVLVCAFESFLLICINTVLETSPLDCAVDFSERPAGFSASMSGVWRAQHSQKRCIAVDRDSYLSRLPSNLRRAKAGTGRAGSSFPF
jgi:hypothetical protein